MAVAHRRKRAPRQRIHKPVTEERVAEIIGRAVTGMAQLSTYRSRYAITSIDETRTDYAFYDLLRRGKQPGYKLGALFAKRIEHIFAVWVLGRGVTLALAESGDPNNTNDPRNYTDSQLSDFIEAEHSRLMTIKEDALGLGDQFIFVNPDGTLSVPSPDTVTVTRDPMDYRTILSVTIATRLPEVTIEDVYTATERVITWKKGEQVIRTERYANLIGRIPCVHIANGMSGNETFGHSIHDDLLKLYDQYDDVLHKQLDGAKLLGNPILAFVGMEDLTAVIDANKPQTPESYVDMNGNEVNRPLLNVDSNSVMLIGKGGDGKFLAPPTGFTADTQQALKTLYMLMVEHTGIPEPLWGNEMSSARASSETQMMQWAHSVEGMQRTDERWLMELCYLWLAWRALVDPQIVVDELKAEWPPVLDENQELRLKYLEYASRENLLTDKTKLQLTELPVDDPEKEVQEAQAEANARAEQDQQRAIAMAQAMPQRGAVGEMVGYNDSELSGIVQGAIRQIAGGA